MCGAWLHVNVTEARDVWGGWGLTMAGWQAAWDAAPVEGKTVVSEQGCFPLLAPWLCSAQRPGTLPAVGNKQDCTNEIGKLRVFGNISEGAP